LPTIDNQKETLGLTTFIFLTLRLKQKGKLDKVKIIYG